MIHLNVTASHDVNAPGEYEFDFDVMSIGLSLRNDLIIKEKSLPQYAIILIVEKDQLFLQTNTHDFFCHVNNTKLSGRKKLLIDDELRIGETIIKISNFKSTQPQENFSLLYQKFIERFPKHQYLLDALNNEMEYLEKKRGLNR